MPAAFAEVHPVYQVPVLASRASACFCAVLAGLFPLDLLGELISFGTLIAFTIVNISVLIKRRDFPDLPSPFMVPGYPYVPIAGAVVCVIQTVSLPPQTFRNCSIWLVIGTIVYWAHSYKVLR